MLFLLHTSTPLSHGRPHHVIFLEFIPSILASLLTIGEASGVHCNAANDNLAARSARSSASLPPSSPAILIAVVWLMPSLLLLVPVLLLALSLSTAVLMLPAGLLLLLLLLPAAAGINGFRSHQYMACCRAAVCLVRNF